MINIDLLAEYPKIDKSNMLQSILDWPDQIRQVWAEAKKLTLPSNYSQIENVVIVGMGTAVVSGECLQVLARKTSQVPMEIINGYEIPEYVGHKTLVVGLSYSGNTEETLSAFTQAGGKGAKLLAVTTGGKLASLCRKYQAPYFTINYGAEARAALGYSFLSLIAIFNRLGLLEIKDEEINEAITLINMLIKKVQPGILTHQNLAKLIAEKIGNRIPVIIGSDNLKGVARRFKQQFNENAKITSYFEIIPEMNHNGLVGTAWPEKLNEKIFVILIQSVYDHQRNKIRQALTQDILERRQIPYEAVTLQPSGSPLAEILCYIIFIDFVSYYKALLDGVDPTSAEIIDYLKEKLTEK